jgi:hypothetical protein
LLARCRILIWLYGVLNGPKVVLENRQRPLKLGKQSSPTRRGNSPQKIVSPGRAGVAFDDDLFLRVDAVNLKNVLGYLCMQPRQEMVVRLDRRAGFCIVMPVPGLDPEIVAASTFLPGASNKAAHDRAFAAPKGQLAIFCGLCWGRIASKMKLGARQAGVQRRYYLGTFANSCGDSFN